MEGEFSGVRRSQRLLGNPPVLPIPPFLGLRSVETLDATTGATTGQDTVIQFETSSVRSTKSGRRGNGSVYSIQSEASRLKLQAEIDSIQRLGKANEELLLAEKQLLLTKQRVEMEQKIEEKRLAMEKIRIDEDTENLGEDLESQLEIPVQECQTNNENDVHRWLSSAGQNVKAENTTGEPVNPVLAQMASTNVRLDRLLSRQAVSKDLPNFSGNPEEWPMFIQQYRRTTEICGLSPDENVTRLEKCLKGKAREAVLPILGLPENVERVIGTLSILFGRSDQILKTMIQKIKSTTPPTTSKPESLILFSNLVANLVATMKNLGSIGQIYNPQLLEELVQRLSYHQQFSWCGYAKRLTQPANLEYFQDWLSDAALTASMMPCTVFSTDEKHDHKKKERKVVMTTFTKGDKSCYCCGKEGHSLIKCKEFEEASIQARWKTVKNESLCYGCLMKGHRGSDCKKKTACGLDGCDRFHHKLLHKTQTEPIPKEEFVGHIKLESVMKEVLLRVIPVKLYGPARTVSTFALLDEGSTITMVDSSIADKLKVHGPTDPLCIQWTNDVTREEMQSRRVSMEISGACAGAKKFRIENARTVSDLALTAQTVNMEMLKEKWPYLRDIPFSSLQNASPMILIGSDNILLTTPRQLRQGHWNDPVATKTWLGWVVHGNLPITRRVDSSFVHVSSELSLEEKLMKMIKETFSTEAFGVRVVAEKSRSKEDERATRIMEATTRRVGNKFETGLLWRSDDIRLPESRITALKRLHSMERKMDKDPSFADQYCNKIQDYIRKGYCRKLSPEEAKVKHPRTYYLPHFAAFNPQKPEKLRLVFDAAAKSHGVSLNDCLLKGPDLLNPLPAVLWRFRRHNIGIAGDIQEMFHQVQISPRDQDSQRFLWRGKEREQEPEEFVMQVMIFGAACSPSSAIYVTQRNAEEFKSEYAEAAPCAIRNTYVDDFTDGADDEEAALKKLNQCVDLFHKGGFNMCNWASSSKAVIQKVPQELRAKKWVDLTDEDALPTERVLGLRWDPENDQFLFQLNFPKVSEEILNLRRMPTKAEVSSVVMSPYDPCGFLTHFIIKGRILIQEIWLRKIEWRDQITGELVEMWRNWVTELKRIVEVRVPRCFAPGIGLKGAKLSLHTFCDASEKAFAAVVYLRIDHTGEVQVGFVAARARVAPLKALSIPRLELQAAVMASRLALTVREHIDLPIASSHYWSDSRTVLCWIRDDSRKYQQFISHRIGEILESTEVDQWRWVPTGENPADEATRNTNASDFNPQSQWFQGPKFLKLNECDWPVENPNLCILPTADELELKKEFVHTATVATRRNQTIDPNQFSTWIRLVRVTAWVQRYLFNFRANHTGSTKTRGELTGEALRKAQVYWWRMVQENNFPEDMKSLKNNSPLPANSKLRTLSPYLDTNNVIRMQGRIGRSEDLEFETKYPVILDPSHRYTRLLLEHLHNEAGHQGIETVLNNARMEYWILRGRSAVKTAFSNCQLCKIRRAKPNPPQMGILPADRLIKQQRPFAVTGLDFFGPFTVTMNRKTVKRYGAIFTCFSTRAIHLEVAQDLTTDSAINVIRRFIARRGVPEVLWSDNGTNFHGADKEMRRAIREIDGDEIMMRFAGKGLTWRFNPPASPHFGGIWERMVRSVKIALEATLTKKTVREDVLHTLFCEAEFIVNNRPLTYVSVDPDDPECLTPNHFLIGNKCIGNIPGVFVNEDLSRRSQWRIVQRYTDMMWTRWVKEYLPTLCRRTKWFQPTAPIKIGDIVVIADKDGPRNSWPLGRIVSVFPGKDGQVRVVDVKTKDGVYRRPAMKICVLDVQQRDEVTPTTSGGRNVLTEEEKSAEVVQMRSEEE